MDRLTTEEFIKRAKLTHKEVYDYSESNYYNQGIKIAIICRTHGVFNQLPMNHIKGYGCKQCTKERKQIAYRERYIKEASVKHNGKYDYSLVEFPVSNKKITIICPVHGQFQQFSNSHLSGCSCYKCSVKDKSKKNRLGKEKFINKTSIIHGDVFKYDKVDYINNNTKVTITCRKHGDFKILPRSIMSGIGCAKCSKTYQYNTEEFSIMANRKHKDFYDYSKSEYINTKTKLKIICPKHGEF